MKKIYFVFLFFFVLFLFSPTIKVDAINISSCGYIINDPGTYFVSQDISQADDGICIEIRSSDVTLDCQGKLLTGRPDVPGENSGIGIKASNVNNVEVKNCLVTSFDLGIYFDSVSFSKIIGNESFRNRTGWTNVEYRKPGGIRVDGGSNNEISENVLFYNYHSLGTSYGIGIFSSHNNTITRNEAGKDMSGTMDKNGIIIIDSNNSIIEENYLSGNITGGIRLHNSDSSIIRKNNTYKNGRGVEISFSQECVVDQHTSDRDGSGVYMNRASLSTVSNSTILSSGSYDIRYSATSDDHCVNTFENIIGSGGDPVELYHSGSFNISDRDFSQLILCNADNSRVERVKTIGQNGGQLRVLRTDNAFFSEITSGYNYKGIEFTNSNGNQIVNSRSTNNWGGINTYSRCSATGFFLNYSNDNTILNFYAKSNWDAICIMNSSGNNIIGRETVIEGNPTGVYLYNSSNNTVSEISIINSKMITWPWNAPDTGRGVLLDRSNNNNILDIRSEENTTGVYLLDSSDNIIENSTITNNNIGLNLNTGSNNRIFNNNICFNTTTDVQCSSNLQDFTNNSCDNGNVCGGVCIPCSVFSFVDIGLRVYSGTEVVAIAAEPLGSLTSPLRIGKFGSIYGVALVDPGDPNDSGVRIQTNLGIKALRRYP